jgi:threonine aldolase
MRQAGIIAAPGIIALERMVERLKEDHKNAQQLAQGVSQIPGLAIDLARVQTNILYFDLVNDAMKPEELQRRMAAKGIKFLQTGPSRFRMVTHYGIRPEHIETTLKILNAQMKTA